MPVLKILIYIGEVEVYSLSPFSFLLFAVAEAVAKVAISVVRQPKSNVCFEVLSYNQALFIWTQELTQYQHPSSVGASKKLSLL